MTQDEMAKKIEDFKALLLQLDCQIEELRIKRANVEAAIGYMELKLFERIMDNAVQEGKYPIE